jgi:hypothetical protein
MQTKASLGRSSIVAVAALFAAACAGPTMEPVPQPQPGGGGASSGGGGSTDGTGGNAPTPTPTPTPTPSPTPTPTPTPTPQAGGCNTYVMCLNNAMSPAAATACDNAASSNAKNILAAEDTCVLSYCVGMTGAAVRCKTATDGSPENLDGSPAFDSTTNAPTGDCGDCLDNGEAGLFGAQCVPTTDPGCNPTACADQVAACHADG